MKTIFYKMRIPVDRYLYNVSRDVCANLQTRRFEDFFMDFIRRLASHTLPHMAGLSPVYAGRGGNRILCSLRARVIYAR